MWVCVDVSLHWIGWHRWVSRIIKGYASIRISAQGNRPHDLGSVGLDGRHSLLA